MKKILLLSLISFQSLAGTLTLKGISNLGLAPEFGALSVNITARCFSSGKEALEASRNATADILTHFKRHQDEFPEAKIQILNPGPSLSYSDIQTIHTYNDLGQRVSEVLCRDSFQVTQRVELRTSHIQDLAFVQADVVDSAPRGVRAKVVVTSGAPRVALYPATVKAQEEKSIASALADASSKFQIIREKCSLDNASIQEIRPAGVVVRNYLDQPVNNPVNALSFEEIYVHQSFDVTFSFNNSTASCQP